MSEKTLNDLDLSTLKNFNAVLQDLTDLIKAENHFLTVTCDPPPKPMLERKEELSEHYTNLTSRMRNRASVLHAAGKLDPVEMEVRIRGLVRMVKENQTLLNARKAATALRVEAVMTALAERERKDTIGYGANGTTMSAARSQNTMMHLRA